MFIWRNTDGWFYTDRDSMLAVAPRSGESEPERIAADRLTQIGRGLREFGDRLDSHGHAYD
jgi:hypothetical protein